MGNKVKKEIAAKSLWMFMKKGKAHQLGLVPLKEYHKFLTPVLETRFNTPLSMVWRITDQSPSQTQKLVEVYYNDMVKAKIYCPGRYGDWIKCTQIEIQGEIYLNIDIIGAAAWNKPTLASDLGIFIKTENQFFFVCIERRNPPGKGLPALIGGILETNKELDSAIFTAIKETEEEAGFKIEPKIRLETIRYDYNIQTLDVTISDFKKLDKNLGQIDAKIQFVKTIRTPEIERNADGTKRVYTTSAYMILIDLGNFTADESSLQKIFNAGDDAKEIFIQNVTECIEKKDWTLIPPFGLEHHSELFQAMVDLIKAYSMQNSF